MLCKPITFFISAVACHDFLYIIFLNVLTFLLIFSIFFYLAISYLPRKKFLWFEKNFFESKKFKRYYTIKEMFLWFKEISWQWRFFFVYNLKEFLCVCSILCKLITFFISAVTCYDFLYIIFGNVLTFLLIFSFFF